MSDNWHLLWWGVLVQSLGASDQIWMGVICVAVFGGNMKQEWSTETALVKSWCCPEICQGSPGRRPFCRLPSDLKTEWKR